ncbi:poly(U)-specific endoribonuclease-like isoform X2 [Acanthaster planci]|uniref:Uridylate-specific endoribonuclease n=1 Tax=Acanthaster planci TaxID=133434 RepID=A0A8B7YGP3_ACAPL|nr:poly(U)-specific endoribonuclease-like isoform X2 [Acanthaster planci]
MLKLWVLGLLAALLPHDADAASSCLGRCGDGYSSSHTCQCNDACSNYGDCCSDYDVYCVADSCAGKCGASYDKTLPCQCNDLCPNYGNCCSDYDSLCTGGGTAPGVPADISAFATAIWKADTSRATVGTDITINYGNYISSSSSTTDVSPNRLFTSIDPAILTRPTFKALINLFDNYVTSQGTTESRSSAEQAEEDAFMDAIFKTAVMTQAYKFVTAKNYFSGSLSQYKDFVRGLLFKPYTRKATSDTSGFEHVFVGEWSSSTSVSGFHNWVRLYLLEKNGLANYHGYLNKIQNGIVKFQFKWSNRVKPITSIMIGGSPEFEVAMFSTCFLKSPNALCKLKLNGSSANIQTYDYKGDDVFGSAYFAA